jgi:hypothetical protein
LYPRSAMKQKLTRTMVTALQLNFLHLYYTFNLAKTKSGFVRNQEFNPTDCIRNSPKSGRIPKKSEPTHELLLF